MSRWSKVDFDSLPSAPGCYVILVDNLYLYVGASANIRQRLGSGRVQRHNGRLFTPWGVCTSLVVKVKSSVRVGDWLMDEYRLIRKLRPVLNSVGSTNRRWDRRDESGFPLTVRQYSNINNPEPSSVEHFVSGTRFIPMGTK